MTPASFALLFVRHQQTRAAVPAATYNKEAPPMATNNTVNRIELIGYMGAMPDMRYTANGAPVTNFNLATNRIWRDQNGETGKATDWHRGTAWGRLAEVVNQYMATGKRVRVIGRLEYQSWTDKETGALRSRAVIVASQVLFLDYDRAQSGLVEEPQAEESAIEAAAQPQAEAPKRRRRAQAA
jgi:single-strand DNA-binding protein